MKIPDVCMTASWRDVFIAIFFLVIGASSAIGGCWVWHLLEYKGSPQAIVDSSQGGETIVRYKDGKAMELVFKPATPEKNGKVK